MFTYKCVIFHLGSGNDIAECEASVNSQETKYKERTVWRTRKRENGTTYRENVKEETAVFDILNTLQKMAQKRALVGATLLATAASEYFTQDLLDPEDIAEAKEQKSESPAESEQKPVDEGGAPQCCEQDMMISKWDDKDLGCKPWYCIKCKSKKPRQ